MTPAPPAPPAQPAPASAVDRARAVRGFLTARRPMWRPSAYQVYVTLFVGAVAGALGGHAVASLVGRGVTGRELVTDGPALLILVSLAALRFGTWQGPVSLSVPDVALLVAAPLDLAAFVRPKLDAALTVGAAGGTIAAGLALVVLAGGPAAIGAGRVAGGVVAVIAFAVQAVAGSWLVQSARPAAGLVRRASPIVFAVAGGLALAASAGAAGRAVATWSGPWGWTVAPFAGAAGWPVAVVLSVGGAVVLVALARRRAGAATPELLMARAETRAGLVASTFTLDYRGAAAVQRSAAVAGAGWAGSRRRRPGGDVLRLPRPRQPGLAVVWRCALSLSREPFRVVWSALLTAGATLETVTHPGDVAAAIVAACALYLAAALLCEPLRVDVDHPDRSALLLSRPFARVVAAHCVLPLLGLVGVTTLTVAGAVVAGAAGPAALALVPTVAAGVCAVSALSAALSARRAGRIDPELLTRMMSIDPMSPAGGLLLIVVTAPWLLLDTVVTVACVLIVGDAVAHHRPAAGAAALAVAISVAVALALVRAVRATRRPAE